MAKTSKALHLKIYCNHCGKLLLHERRERLEENSPLAQYIGLTVDPCEDCLGSSMRRMAGLEP